MRVISCDSACPPYLAFQRPACPNCGDMLFAAKATEFLGGGHVRHTWSCESCDHEFATLLDLPESV